MEFALLGPLVVHRDGAPVEIGSRKQRALLIHLLLRAGQTVPVDRLIDALWDDDPPPQARVTLRSYISSLRRALHTPATADVIVTRSNGYSIQVEPAALDTVRFEDGVAAARAQLTDGRLSEALASLDGALGLWRGQALADLGDSDFGSGDRTRLEELRLAAQEDRFDVLLGLGRHVEAVASLEAFTAAEPLRERAQAQLMLSLYRSGRAPDALKSFSRFRDTLVEELGLDPSPQLQQLADRMLNQSPDLDATAPVISDSRRARGRPPAVDEPATPLIGREHERSELRTAVVRLAAGEGGLLLLTGEPGIGKTALLEELARLAAAEGGDIEVRWGRCHETGGPPAFWPWTQILRAIVRDMDDSTLASSTAGAGAAVAVLVEEAAGRTGLGPPRAGDDMEGARFALYDGIGAFLLAAAEKRPLMLLLDDIHWADTASLQALTFLTPLLAAGRILVAGTFRDTQADWADELEPTLATVVRDPSTQQLGLAGLHPRDVAQLAQREAGEALAPHHLDLLHERAGGNPFFVRQLSGLLRDAEPDAQDDAGIPTGVRHVLARRLSMLSGEQRHVLEAAAALGRHFDLRRVASACDLSSEAVLAAVERGVEHGLLEPGDPPGAEYRFVHALVRETVYEAVPPHRRARLHRSIAEALESLPTTPVAELAEHFWQAAHVTTDDRPARYLVAAADEALEVLGYEQAESYLQRALRVSEDRDPAAGLTIRVKLAQLLIAIHGWSAPAIEDVAGPARQLVRRTGTNPEIVRLLTALVTLFAARGTIEGAQAVAAQLLEGGSAAEDPLALVAGHSAVAFLDLTLGRQPTNALEHLREAHRHLPAVPSEDLQWSPHIGVQVVNLEAVALAVQGSRDAAVATARRAVGVAEQDSDPFSQANAYTNAGLVGVLLDDAAFAREMTAAGLALCERHGFRMAANVLTTSDSWARARLGDEPGRQADRMRDALRTIVAAGHGHPRAKYLLFTAETYLVAGDPAAAAQCLREAREHSRRTGEALPEQRLARAAEAVAAATTGGAPAGGNLPG